MRAYPKLIPSSSFFEKVIAALIIEVVEKARGVPRDVDLICNLEKPHLDLRRTGDLERERLLGDRDLDFSGDFDRDRDLAKMKLSKYLRSAIFRNGFP